MTRSKASNGPAGSARFRSGGWRPTVAYRSEPLEPRRLLAGVTVITHGFELIPGELDSGETAWMDQMASAISVRAGGADIYRVDIGPTNLVTPPVPVLQSSSGASTGESIIEVDWSDLADYLVTPVSAGFIGDSLESVLTQWPTPQHPFAQLPIHLIGHSRGASVVSELAKQLGQDGIWVDQVTTLDPHPLTTVDPQAPAPALPVLDSTVNEYDNVVFADNYFEDSNLLYPLVPVPDGESIAGALNFGPLSLPGGNPNFPLGFGDHSDVHTWYNGTVETGTNTDGSATFDPTAWYDGNGLNRDLTGYYYSRVAGGTRPQNGLGTGSPFGGLEPRVSLVHSSPNPQWPNIGFIASPNGSVFTVGQSIPISFKYEDWGKSCDVVLFLDTDQNPYDGFLPGDSGNVIGPDSSTRPFARGYQPSYSPTYAPTDSSAPVLLDTNQVAGGTYYVCAEIKDNDYSRFAYLPIQITLSTPTQPVPVITSVAPATLQVQQSRQLLQIFGSGFTPSSTLLFNVGGQSIPSTAAYLTFINSSEIDYQIAVGSAAAAWTVQVIGQVPSNSVGFNVVAPSVDSIPPTAVLSYPANGAGILQSTLNAGGYLWVTYSDVGAGIDPTTITSGAAKFSLSGSGVGSAVVSSVVTLVAGTASTYRYGFTGSFATGQVALNFQAGTFADLAGNRNTAMTQTFTVTSSSVQTGALQVVIYPQNAVNAGAQWSLGGGNFQQTSATLSGLAAVAHSIHFKPISGWRTPSDESITVVAGQTTTISATYQPAAAPTYMLSITTINGSVIRSPLASSFAAGTVVTLTAQPDMGYHFANWTGAVSSTQNPLTITMDSDKSLTANYATGDLTHGTLQVTITPASALSAGAMWSIDGGSTWYIGSATLQGLAAGQYAVKFSPLGGFTKPSTQIVSVPIGQTTQVSGAYVPDPQFGSIQVGITPPGAVAAGAQWQLDGGAWQSTATVLAGISVGAHQIAFNSVSGWSAPPTQTVQVTVNQSTVVTGTYSPPVGVPAIYGLSPQLGPLAGGIPLTIYGVNFAAPASVTVGGLSASNVVVVSATQVTATLPPGNAYISAAVSLTTAGGTATDTGDFRYGKSDGNNIQLLGEFGGSVGAVTIQGSYAYASEGARLDIFSISSPTSPSLVGHVGLPAPIADIQVSGQFAYIADENDGLQVVDVSIPSAPVLRGYYFSPGSADDVQVLGGLAYIADGSAGLQILDVTNPLAPVLVGSFSAPAIGLALSVSSAGVFSYDVDGSNNLRVINVANPATPALQYTLTLPYGASSIVFNANAAYLSGSWFGGPSSISIINISNAALPTLLGNYTSSIGGNGFEGLAVANNTIFAGASSFPAMIDVSNPSSPVLISNLPAVFGTFAPQVALSGSWAFFAAAGSGLEVVDGSHPSATTVAGKYNPIAAYTQDLALAGSQLYVAGPQLQIIDATDPTNPALLGQATPTGQSVVAANSTAYVATGNHLAIVTVSSSGVPTIAGSIGASPIDPVAISVRGTTAFLAGIAANANSSPEFSVADVSNPSSPTIQGSYIDPLPLGSGGSFAVAVSGNYAYFIDSTSLHVMDVTNLSSPNPVGLATTANGAFSAALSSDGRYLFVGETGAIEVFDVTTPTQPKSVSVYSLPTGSVAWRLVQANGLLYAACLTAGLQVFDYTNPTSLKLVASYQDYESDEGLAISGNQIYVAATGRGVEVLQMLDFQPPTTIITNPTFNSTYSTSNGTMNLGGSATDNVGVVKVVWSNDRGGSGIASGLASWVVTGVQLQPGQNVLTVTAYDAAGNQGIDSLTVTYTPVPASQSITFNAISNDTFGDPPVALNATASSGLPVTYAVTSGPAAIAGNILTITGAGSITVRASQSGNPFFSAAAVVDQSFSVAQAAQTISFAALTDKTLGDLDFFVNPIASSGLPVSLSVLSGPAVVTGSTVLLTGAGAVVLQGTQQGDSNYLAASPVSASFSVGRASQSISFPPLSGQRIGDASFPLIATDSSGLPLQFTVVSGPATISSNLLTVTGAGTVTVRASQSGDLNYLPAANVDQSFQAYPPLADVATGSSVSDTISLTMEADQQHIDWSIGSASGAVYVGDLNGLTLNSNGGNDSIVLNYANGNPIPPTLHLNGIFTLIGVQGSNPLANTTMEIGRSTVFINYANPATDPIAAIRGYLKAGLGNGTWNGTPSANTGAITSTAAAANAAQTTGIGYADSADGLIPGQPANTIELKYTLYGDTTLTGTVGFNDFTRLTQHWNQTAGGTWDTGDFNYDGSVNNGDFTLMSRTYNTSVGSQALPAVSAATLAVSAASSNTAPAPSAGSVQAPAPVKKPIAVQVDPAPTPPHHTTASKAHKKRHR